MGTNNMESEIVGKVEVFCREIEKIWSQIGISKEAHMERRKEASMVVSDVLDGMLNEEKNALQTLQDNVELARKDIKQITSALKMPPVREPPDFSLCQLETYLVEEARKLNNLKKERTQRLSALLESARALCSQLDESLSNKLSESEIPSDSELEMLKKEVDRLKFLKVERMSEAETLKAEVQNMYDLVEEDPRDLTISRHLLVDLELHSIITPSAMSELAHLRSRLEEKVQLLTQKADSIREKLTDIYARLDLPLENMNEFLSQNPGCQPSTIRVLETELDRCLELKRQNIEKFVINCRTELEQYWNACYFSEDSRSMRFKPFFSTNFSEALLDLHETELEKMRAFYTKAKPVLDVFKQHCEVWNEFVEMERKANDPSRLLSRGRGGGLLQEQKKRKDIERKIPKIEEKLKNLVSQWESESGELFPIEDIPIFDYINYQKELLEQEKEANKRAKIEEKEREKENELRYGSKSAASKRNAAAMSKLSNANSTNTPAKKSKVLGNTTNVNQTMKSNKSNSVKKPIISGNILSTTKAKPTFGKPMLGIPLVPTKLKFGASGNSEAKQPKVAPTGSGIAKPTAVQSSASRLQKVKRKSLAQLNKKKAQATKTESPLTEVKVVKHTAAIEPPARLVPLRRSQRIQLNTSKIMLTNFNDCSHLVADHSVVAGNQVPGFGGTHDLESTTNFATFPNPLMSSSALYPK